MGTSLESSNNHPQETIEGSATAPPPARTARSGIRRLIGLVVVASVAVVCVWWWSIESKLERAQRAAARGAWNLAVDQLDRYLKWHPEDAAAHLLMAEACIKSEHEDLRDAAGQAITHLQQINNDSPLAAKARLQEGRLALLLLKEPARAERSLRESLQLEPESIEANLLLWKLLDVTGRHVMSDPYFWKAYKLSPESGRAVLLRDWFLSEFYPETLYAELYRHLGAKAAGKFPASVSLLVQFREIEPEAAFLHAAIANYFLDLGNLNSTMEMLKEAPDLERAMKDSFYVAVLFDALVDLGEFPKARICFEQYPQPHAGYLFWRTEGMFQDHVERDNAAAVRAYRQALTTPPAKFDWGLMSRLSVCLRKSGEVDESQSIQAQVDHLTTDVLTAERTSHLRQIISRLDDPEVARELREFYAEFGLQREVAAWQEQENRLRSGKKTLQTPFTFE